MGKGSIIVFILAHAQKHHFCTGTRAGAGNYRFYTCRFRTGAERLRTDGNPLPMGGGYIEFAPMRQRYIEFALLYIEFALCLGGGHKYF